MPASVQSPVVMPRQQVSRLVSLGSSVSPDSDGVVGLRATVSSQNATIQELERRLAFSSTELADRDIRIAELTRRNAELAQIAKDCGAVVPPAPAPKARAARRSSPGASAPRQASAIQDVTALALPERPQERGSSLERPRDASVQRNSTAPRSNDADTIDDIDTAIKGYLQDRPDEGIEFEKIKKGWYLVKPLNKKVFLKHAGKDKLVVRVGGGHVSMQKFLDDFALMAVTSAHEAATIALSSAKKLSESTS